MKRWPTRPLGEVAQVTAGDPAPQRPEDFSPDGMPFVRMQDVGRHGQTTCLAETKDRLSASTSLKLKRFPIGSILVPKSGASIRLNHRAILGVEAHVVSHLAIIMPHQSLDTRFVYYWLCATDLSDIAHKADLPSMKTSELAKLHVPVPPLPEQERIATLLDEVNRFRNLRTQADRRTADLIPALFDQMFKEPNNFPRERLESACDFITKGSTPPPGDITDRPANNNVPFLKVYHVTDDGSIDFSYRPSFIDRALHQGTLRRSAVYPGDVLMNIVGPPLGRIGLVPTSYPEWNVNQALAIFRPKQGQLVSLYLLYALRSSTVLPAILNQAVGIRQLNLSLEQCRNVVIPVPPLQLQRQFAMTVTEIRELQAEQLASRERIETLFQSMLHRAFRGEL